MKNKDQLKDIPAIIINGLNKEQTLAILRAIRSLEEFPEIIFATTTEINKNWKLEDLIFEIKKEHDFIKKNKR